MAAEERIEIHNARVHNLKGIDVTIPRDALVVITGVSGSGKSSLAFDTIYAEGQRRYVESLSSYIRQFLGRMNKPEVDYIHGLPPAIAIEQKVINNNPRSTVGTTTEIYDYLALLFARIGHTYSPVTGREVKHHTVEDVLDYIFSLEPGTTVDLLIHSTLTPTRLIEQGFSRILIDDRYERLSEYTKADKPLPQKARLVVAHVTQNNTKELRNRLYDSIETAFYEGRDALSVYARGQMRNFSRAFEADGIRFEEPTERLFQFNNPLGACPVCNGFGNTIGIDPDLVIPNHTLSVYQDAILPWRGPVMGRAKQQLILNAEKFGFPIHTPYGELTEAQKELLWTGNQYFEGLNDFFKNLEQQQQKIQYRVILARYRGRTRCPECHGTRLRREAGYVRIADHTISELVEMPVDQLLDFFLTLKLKPAERQIAARLIKEITARLTFLKEVGLAYLTLNRQSNTLSGGESQRINLAKSLGSALVGSLYVLDEPSIGLHPTDTRRLIQVLQDLKKLGNTVIVVEHDEEIIRQADYIIDIGPQAGSLGGRVIAQGTPEEIMACPESLTGQALRGLIIPRRNLTPRTTSNYIEIKGAAHNNLKNIDVRFPLGIMTAVTGVSGSGKSTLIHDILYNALCRHFDHPDTANISARYNALTGALNLIDDVQMVDQNPIGRSSRSNPVTYIKAYDDIRKLFAEQPLARQMEYTQAHFSFNVDGGRCPVCQGEGTVTIPMQFMADIVMPCEACHGTRFKREILEVKYRDHNIHDILTMTVDQAVAFFAQDPECISIVRKLKPLQEVGLGYVKLGQSSSTLSGGESQRVKLAYYLSQSNGTRHILFILDEPTTGLHTADIARLIHSLDRLIAQGHTVIVVEHNLNVIAQADHIIDLGPHGGEQGGEIVYAGPTDKIGSCEASLTGKALTEYLASFDK